MGEALICRRGGKAALNNVLDYTSNYNGPKTTYQLDADKSYLVISYIRGLNSGIAVKIDSVINGVVTNFSATSSTSTSYGPHSIDTSTLIVTSGFGGWVSSTQIYVDTWIFEVTTE